MLLRVARRQHCERTAEGCATSRAQPATVWPVIADAQHAPFAAFDGNVLQRSDHVGGVLETFGSVILSRRSSHKL